MASKMMYTTLVHFTGAKPAEYYSVQKRPEYKKYQKNTSIFFQEDPDYRLAICLRLKA
jgi:steroid 5-alpha reductase family enzyme